MYSVVSVETKRQVFTMACIPARDVRYEEKHFEYVSSVKSLVMSKILFFFKILRIRVNAKYVFTMV